MDAKHFPAFYKRHVKKIYRFLYYRTGGNREWAEDLTQDVFLKALKSFDAYDPARGASAWIYTIARNHLINELAKQKPAIPLEEIENAVESGGRWDAGVEQRDAERRMLDALGTLSPDEHALIRRKYLEGWSFRELADAMETTSGALRVKAARAMKKLRNTLS